MPEFRGRLSRIRQTTAKNLGCHFPKFPIFMRCANFHFLHEVSG